jgi:NAD(P)H dehydrogenase (quinone)
MKVLVVFAHPTKNSFCGSILAAVLEELTTQGHEAKLLDLYTERFNPVLSETEWQCYETSITSEIQQYAKQIHDADGLIWVFPTWNYGLPAILKGYVDRVWKPNVAFRIDQSRNVRFDLFNNLKFFIVITTYGASRVANALVRNPCKQVLLHGLRRHLSLFSGFAWLALYGMDKPSSGQLNRFLVKVRQIAKDYPVRFGDAGARSSPRRKVARFLRALYEWFYRHLPL